MVAKLGDAMPRKTISLIVEHLAGRANSLATWWPSRRRFQVSLTFRSNSFPKLRVAQNFSPTDSPWQIVSPWEIISLGGTRTCTNKIQRDRRSYLKLDNEAGHRVFPPGNELFFEESVKDEESSLSLSLFLPGGSSSLMEGQARARNTSIKMQSRVLVSLKVNRSLLGLFVASPSLSNLRDHSRGHRDFQPLLSLSLSLLCFFVLFIKQATVAV